MTHILIPIKEFDKLKKEFYSLKMSLVLEKELDNISKRNKIIGKLELMSTGKKISLDEKDIEAKANKEVIGEFLDYADIKYWERKGYQQALLDLKNII